MRTALTFLPFLLLLTTAKQSPQQARAANQRKQVRQQKSKGGGGGGGGDGYKSEGGGGSSDGHPRPSAASLNRTCSAASATHTRSVPGMLCAGYASRPPRVAVCLAGGARTFPHALVKRSLRENLIDALGVGSSSLQVFAHLKLADKRGDDRSKFNGKVHATRSQVLEAAADVGMCVNSPIYRSVYPFMYHRL